MRTRRLLFRATAFLVMLLTVFAGPVTPVLAQDPIVRVMPAAPTVEVGQTVVVSVTIESVTNLFGAEFHLEFDPSIVEVVDADASTGGVQIAPGSFLSPDFIVQNQANNTVGTIDFAVSQTAPNAPVSGSGTLATITFRGRAGGTSTVSFTSVTLSDSTGGQITASAQNGSVTVGGPAPTATPTSAATATPPPTSTNTPPPTQTPGPTNTPGPTQTGTVVASPTPTPVAATATPPPPAPTATQPASGCASRGTHVVRAGETLYSIGRAYATLPLRIASCNGIVNPSRIFVGMQLGIPTAPWSPIPAGPVAVRQFEPGGAVPTPVPTAAPATCRFYHTVQRGHTLTAIAIRYGSSIWAVGRVNNIYNLNLIFPGQVLCIP